MKITEKNPRNLNNVVSKIKDKLSDKEKLSSNELGNIISLVVSRKKDNFDDK